MASARMKAAKDELYRQVIIEAAESVFADGGYDEAKVTEIAEKAGVSLGTLYKVFEGKADLHAAVHARRAEEIYETAAAALTTFDSPFSLMLRAAEAYVRFQAEHPSYLRMVLREGYAWSEPIGLPHTHQRAVWEKGIELAANVLSEGIGAGELQPGPPERHARMLIAIMQILLADWVARGMVEPPGRLAADVLDTLVRSLASDTQRERWFSNPRRTERP